MLDKTTEQALRAKAAKLRCLTIDTIYQAQSGHPGGSLSVCEILTTLYFEEMNVDPKDPQMADRDRLVLCKGHAAPMLYRSWRRRASSPWRRWPPCAALRPASRAIPAPWRLPA